MPIPPVSELDDLVRSLRFLPPSNAEGWKSFEIAAERGLSNKHDFIVQDAILLWHPVTSKASPESLCQRVSNELSRVGHPSNDRIARAIVALATLRPQRSIETINQLIAEMRSTNISEHLIAAFPPHPDTDDFSIGQFNLGKIDREKLIYECNRVGCDYFSRYPESFKGMFAIGRRAKLALTIPTFKISDVIGQPTLNSAGAQEVVSNYFHELTSYFLALFRQEFITEQYVPVAAGAPAINVWDFNFWFGSSFVCIFTWREIQTPGYFCPLGQIATVEFAAGDKRFPKILRTLETDYGFVGLRSSEIHHLIKSFSRMVTSAVMRDVKSQSDEVFLRYVIALDLVFGERDSSNQSVSRRAAVVSSSALGVSPASASERMKELYDVRSRFIHAGTPVAIKSLESVKPIVDAVFICLMRLQSRESSHAEGYPVRWLKSLDLLWATYAAGREPSETDLREAGVTS